MLWCWKRGKGEKQATGEFPRAAAVIRDGTGSFGFGGGFASESAAYAQDDIEKDMGLGCAVKGGIEGGAHGNEFLRGEQPLADFEQFAFFFADMGGERLGDFAQPAGLSSRASARAKYCRRVACSASN